MPEQKVFVAPFMQGLDTEKTDIVDSGAYTSDELNFSIYSGEIRGRRYGMSVERDGEFLEHAITETRPTIRYMKQVTFDAGTDVKEFQLPANLKGPVHVDCIASKGRDGNITTAGKGGRVQCDLNIAPGTTLYITVGSIPPTQSTATYNASDIRLGGTSLDNRIVVAGGGGSGVWNQGDDSRSFGREGANGGGLTGARSPDTSYWHVSANGATGGSQTAGGVGQTTGSFGLGGNGTSYWIVSGAGGAGYYGGGGGQARAGQHDGHRYRAGTGGGGGSSYTDETYASNVIHTQGYMNGQGFITLDFESDISDYTYVLEEPGEPVTETIIPEGRNYTGYFWKNVGNTDTDFIVYRVDQGLYFFDAGSKPFSTHAMKIDGAMSSINLNRFITNTDGFYNFPVRFSTGDGELIVVSKYMKPVRIAYDFTNKTFSAHEVTIKYRDLEGVEDNTAIDEQPATLSNEHKYNLLNQGWNVNQITQFYSNRNRYPSNNMQWFLGKDNSGNYATEELLKKYFGNSPAPKGHFILDYFNKNRSEASGITSTGGKNRVVEYSQASGWVHGRSLGYRAIYDFSVTFESSRGTAVALLTNFTNIQRKIAKKAWGEYKDYVIITVYGLSTTGTWVPVFSERHYFSGKEQYLLNFPNSIAYQQYKVHYQFDPTISGTSRWESYPGQVAMTATISLLEDGDPFETYKLDVNKRITDIAFMSGKFFYLTGDSVLFSQTITDTNKGFDKCYQDADPTSEEISDVIPSDGGYVKFETMGDGIALATFNRGVLVFGRDVVYGLLSPMEGRFTATDYDIVQLSRAGLIGSESVVSVADQVFYWSPLGIFRIGVNPQTGNTMVAENVSQTTIKSFYNELPVYSKEHCKAAFDYANNRIYWYYPLDFEDLTKLNGVLVYDLNYGAFMPMKIADGGKVTAVFETLNSYEVHPTMYLRAGGQRVVAGGKYVTASEETSTYNRYTAIQHCIEQDGKISFGDYNSREFLDWDLNSYDSYMVSKPILLQDNYYLKQVPILQALFKRTEEGELKTPKTYIAASGAYLRMRWGWSLNDRSNRWDIIQNAYRPQKDFMKDEYVESRIHIRGRGRAFQIEVRNDDNKDLRLAGINVIARTDGYL